jgi:hypothetical protein
MSLVPKILQEAFPSTELSSLIWYHGTSLKNGLIIIGEGFIKPSEIVTKRTKRFMAPQYNSVYLTQSLNEALNYSHFRSPQGINSCLIIINGKELQDIDPDEDTIADLIPDYVKDNDGNHKFPWLVNLAQTYFPKELKKYNTMGDYRYGTALGKKLMPMLSDKQKFELINVGKKIAHKGKVLIDSAWEIPFNLQEKDYPNFKRFSKQLK